MFVSSVTIQTALDSSVAKTKAVFQAIPFPCDSILDLELLQN